MKLPAIKPSGKQRLTQSEKGQILERQKFVCKGKICKVVFDEKIKPHYHHIKPVSKSKNLSNIHALCPSCHDKKRFEK